MCSLHLEVTTQKPWLVVGDSHAQHLWPYFDARSKDRRIDFMTSGGCPPLPGLNTAAPGYDCPRVFDRVRGLVQTGRYERVIVASWWDGYFVGDAPLCVWQKGRCQDAVIGLDDARPAFDAAVAIWSEWRGRGVDVFVVLPEPRLRVNQPREMARRRYLGLDESPAEFISQDDYFRSVGPVRAEVARAARLAGAAVIDPAAQLCHEGQCRFVDGAGHPILRDGSHFRSSWAAQGMHYPDELLRGTSKAQEVGTLDSRPRP